MARKVKCINCVNLKDDWCEKVIDSPCPDSERDCQHFRQKTNGDRIRAMSDAQLAKHFSGLICDINEGVEYHANPNRWLEWLRQPVEDK